MNPSRLTSLNRGAISACGPGSRNYGEKKQHILSAYSSPSTSPQLEIPDDGRCPQSISTTKCKQTVKMQMLGIVSKGQASFSQINT